MSLLTLIAVLAIIGLCLWLVVTYVPMPAPFAQIIIAIVVIILVLWVARMLIGDFTVGLPGR